MAVLVAFANGNLTSSSTWETADSTSYLNSETGNTAVTTSYVESSGFTPGAITIDGIAVKIASRAASPTGTISVRLAQAGVLVANTEITVNVSDLPTCTATSGTTTPVDTAEGGWFFFKFGTNVTLAGATAYTLSAKTSSGSQVNLWRDSTAANWSRYLRTTTTAAPAAGDDMIITGEWTAAATVTARTVTMDSTANTDYGSASTSQVTPSLAICKSGTLVWGTSASTNYILRQSGNIVVYNGGTYSQGASGAEIPRNSTAALQMDCASDGDFGVIARNGSTVNMYGLSRTSGKNVTKTKLNADAAASATSLTLVDDTGWLSGDVLCIASTTRTSTQFESKAATGNATATTIAVNALTNAHSGTSPTQAEVGLLTRNNSIKAVTANVVTFVYGGSTAAVNISWTECRYLSTGVSGKVGLSSSTTTGTFNVSYSSVYDCDCMALQINGASGAGTVNFSNCIFYNFNLSNGNFNTVQATTVAWVIDNCMFCGGTQGSPLITLADVGGTFTNNSISGSPSHGLNMAEQNALGTFSGLEIHSNASLGITWSNSPTGSNTISSSNFWRNNSFATTMPGMFAGTAFTFSSCNFFGNNGTNVRLGGSGSYTFDTCTLNGDTTFSTTVGIDTNSGNGCGVCSLYNCSLSVVSGIKTKHTNDIDLGNGSSKQFFVGDNTILNGTNIYTGATSLQQPPYQPVIQVQNFGQTANDNRAWFLNATSTMGLVQSDSGTVHGTDPLSEKLTPASASLKLRTAPKYVACNSGSTSTFSIYVQKNGSYNGNAPRLILLRQDSMGITSDTVCATFSAGASTWQQLSYTTPTAPQNGVWAFVVDCDGTAGSIFVGDAAA